MEHSNKQPPTVIVWDHLPIEQWHFSEISSTQAYAGQLEFNPDQWILISSDLQTSGVGQYHRKWSSHEAGNIYATLVLPVEDKYMTDLKMLPQMTGLSIIQALQSLGVNAKLKWVNDLMLNKKKLGGILCESKPIPKTNLLKCLIGFGVNVNATASMFEGLDQPATSLFIENHKHYNVTELLYLIIENIYNNFNILFESGFDDFINAISELLEYKGETIRLVLQEDPIKGIVDEVSGKILGLSREGSLLLVINNQEVRTFNYGRIIIKSEL